MNQNKWWRFLHSLGLEFWLPLPLLGLAFWFVSGLVTEHRLNQSNPSAESFKITADKVQPASKIVSIKVTVDRDRNLSTVKIKQTTQVLQQEEFEIPTTELVQIETAIAQKLNLSSEKVRQLLRYQIE